MKAFNKTSHKKHTTKGRCRVRRCLKKESFYDYWCTIGGLFGTTTRREHYYDITEKYSSEKINLGILF